VADDYATNFGDDLDRLVLDRRILDGVADRSAGAGFVLDLGCGPAQISNYLVARDANSVGIDFTDAMLRVARQRADSLPLLGADVCRLPIRTGVAAGVVAFYVLQHLRRSELVDALLEVRRVLVDNGVFALAVHAGTGELQLGDVTATRYQANELTRQLVGASFSVETVEHRGPLPHEHQGDRIYIVARAG
jgi:SAM-dependent methyltransferase